MESASNQNLIPKELSGDQYKTLFEQYKILVDSASRNNDIRESLNNYWITVNSLGISAIAYVKDHHFVSKTHQPFIMWTFVILGIFLCSTWLNSLFVIKKSTDIRYDLITELEGYLPVKMFTKVFNITDRINGKSSLTIREMIVPCFFLSAYLIFGFILYTSGETILQKG